MIYNFSENVAIGKKLLQNGESNFLEKDISTREYKLMVFLIQTWMLIRLLVEM